MDVFEHRWRLSRRPRGNSWRTDSRKAQAQASNKTGCASREDADTPKRKGSDEEIGCPSEIAEVLLISAFLL